MVKYLFKYAKKNEWPKDEQEDDFQMVKYLFKYTQKNEWSEDEQEADLKMVKCMFKIAEFKYDIQEGNRKSKMFEIHYQKSTHLEDVQGCDRRIIPILSD